MRRTIQAMMSMLALGASAFMALGASAQTLQGTAFSVASDYLITNQHVVAGCQSVEVIGLGERRRGSIVATDTNLDLALLLVSGMKGAAAKLRSPRTVRLGEVVNVFGFPLAGSLASGGNFTSGLISGLRGLRDAAGAIQFMAPV